MKNMDPTKVLNNNMEYLIDYLMCELKSLGKINELSNSQLIEMERQFIARLAFAAIIGDDEKEFEKEPEKEPEKKTFPDEVWKALRFIKNSCDHECKDCPFGSGSGLICDLNNLPSYWEV